MSITNVAEFENGKKIFQITSEEMAKTPVSDMLCSNFIEVGFGYQVEAMWSEMFFNRSFEKSFQITPATYDWFGGEDVVGNDWTEQEWYHTGYEHNRWYACPAKDHPACMAPDCSFIIPKAPFYSLTVAQEEGGIHGKHCLTVHNFEMEDLRWCGVAQDGKLFKKGQSYHFRGYFKNVGEMAAQAELRIYLTKDNDWESPVAVYSLGEISKEGKIYEYDFEQVDFEGWATFAVFVSPGAKVMLDAFSLKPKNTVNGWRPDVIEGLKRVNPALIRFPGGCFASLHDWHDAIGPIDQRKPEPSYFWGDINYNDVGTDEFLQLCEAIDSKAMLVVNMFHPNKKYMLSYDPKCVPPGRVPHGFVLDHITDIQKGVTCAAQWVEYCNGSVDTEFGALRAKNGHPQPYGVKYWEMDNEPWRWFDHKEYARTVVEYSKAMKAIDPEIKLGICTYHFFRFDEVMQDMLDICGEYIDFLADRICEPDNIAAKIAMVRKFNSTHEHKIFYTDTEALQNRDPKPAPFVGKFYQDNGITIREARRTWIYALSLVSNLMMDQRYGGEVKFMCFNNLANTSGQSCIETPKEGVVIPACGLIYEQMSRSKAAWPLKISGYTPTNRKEIEIQAAWDLERNKLVIYLVNRCDESTKVTLDFASLGKDFCKASQRRMSATGGRVQETVKSQGNIHYEYDYFPVNAKVPNTFEIPKFSFTEIVIE